LSRVAPASGRLLTNVGGVRERPAVTRRGRGKTVCARGAYWALPGGPSTSPLEGVNMLSAVFCAVVGLALLFLGGFGIRSLPQAPADRIPLIYGAVMMGLVLFAYGTLKLVFWSRRQRHLGPLFGGDGYPGLPISGSVSHGSTGHDGDCGHGDGGGGDGGGCGGDAGVSH
jgi:hypothetical protein